MSEETASRQNAEAADETLRFECLARTVRALEERLAAVRAAYEGERAGYKKLLEEYGPDLMIHAIACLGDLEKTIGSALSAGPAPIESLVKRSSLGTPEAKCWPPARRARTGAAMADKDGSWPSIVATLRDQLAAAESTLAAIGSLETLAAIGEARADDAGRLARDIRALLSASPAPQHPDSALLDRIAAFVRLDLRGKPYIESTPLLDDVALELARRRGILPVAASTRAQGQNGGGNG